MSLALWLFVLSAASATVLWVVLYQTKDAVSALATLVLALMNTVTAVVVFMWLMQHLPPLMPS